MKLKRVPRIIGVVCLAMLSFSEIQAQPCIANTNSLDFNGTGSAVRINTINGLDITNQITIEAWVNAAAFASGPAGGSIFCKHAWGSSTFGYVLRAGGSGQLSFNIAGAVGGSPVGWKEAISPVNALTLNTWHHVAGVFDGTMVFCYVDGLPVGSTAFSGTIYPSTGIKARIGALADTNWGMTRYWDGYIDEVRVWNRALTQSEIASGMGDHIDPASATGLVGYWRLNEGSGVVAADLGTGSNSGTLLNASWTTQTGFNNPPPAVPVITYTAGQLHSSSAVGNQWYSGTTLIPNATAQNYTPTAYGTYSVRVTVNGCTSISAPFNYNTTEIPEIAQAQLQISPNPVADELSVRLPDSKQAFSYSIYDVSGSLVLEGFFQKNTASLSVSALPSGVYMLKTGNGDQEFTTRFVKR
jgi:hypothetical protein